jgi:inner membrane protein
MDPLTHTLVGANLASTRLGLTTRFAAAALVIGANLPDVDAILYFTGHEDEALGFRRGWTHGILALFVLPVLLAAALYAIDRIRPSATRTARLKPLLLLSFLAVWTHPFLDWLNTYGMRWLMPFDGRWFYGDSVYIMDPWLWLALGVGFLAARRPTVITVGAWMFFTGAIVWVVGRRSPEYLGVVGLVALALLMALVWRPGVARAESFARGALVVAALYIGARLIIHAVAVNEAGRQLAQSWSIPSSVERLLVGPHPLDPLRWNFTAQTEDTYYYGTLDLVAGGITLHPETLPVAKDSPEYRAAAQDPSVRGFMTWVRFPSYRVERAGGQTRVVLMDARRRGSGGRAVVLP